MQMMTKMTKILSKGRQDGEKKREIGNRLKTRNTNERFSHVIVSASALPVIDPTLSLSLFFSFSAFAFQTLTQVLTSSDIV